jgi:hypothetical protein
MSQIDIERVTKFKLDGVEYDSLNRIKDAVETKIGEEVVEKIIKAAPDAWRYKEAIHDVLCSPEVRKSLLKYLDVEYEDFFDRHSNSDPKVKNILDYQLSTKKK